MPKGHNRVHSCGWCNAWTGSQSLAVGTPSLQLSCYADRAALMAGTARDCIECWLGVRESLANIYL
eukprot:6200357-Pleurochrysis_carterae.AAC.2